MGSNYKVKRFTRFEELSAKPIRVIAFGLIWPKLSQRRKAGQCLPWLKGQGGKLGAPEIFGARDQAFGEG